MPPLLMLRVLAILIAILQPSPGAELRLSAAASLGDALPEINKSFEKTTGIRVLLNLGGSGTLTRQILAGAPADLFFSADPERLDELESRKLLLADTRRDLLSNTLVIIAPAESTRQLENLAALTRPEFRRIVIGNPQTVPAGKYARELLTGAGIWEQLEPRIVGMDNVRAVLAVVGSGNADAGIVYRTDASASRQVKVLYQVPEREGPRIRYTAAILRQSAHSDAARAWLDHVSQPASREIFRKAGFLILTESVPPPVKSAP